MGTAILDPDVLVDSLVVDVIDGLRGDLHPQFGVRPFHVWTVLREWSGETQGEGDYTDVEVELEPQPRVWNWTGYRWDLTKAGLDDIGEIKVTEVSLSNTYAELTGGTLAANQQWFIKLTEAYGQLQPARYFSHFRPPFPDREKDMGWVLWLRPANVPGCGP